MPRKIRPIRIEGNIAYVTLTKGYEAVIDAVDVDIVARFNWTAYLTTSTVYAARKDTSGAKQINFYLHRAIMGNPAGIEVDHINGDGLDNRRCNLRAATRSQNAQNTRVRSDNTSGVKGVWWDSARRKWASEIRVRGRKLFLGRHNDLESACEAYAYASEKFHGEFRRTD
jgi:hypothetical protein